jgi:hypothetical protein
MGILGPLLGYVVVTRFRKARRGWDVNMEITRRMLSDFGFHESDLRGGGKLIEI